MTQWDPARVKFLIEYAREFKIPGTSDYETADMLEAACAEMERLESEHNETCRLSGRVLKQLDETEHLLSLALDIGLTECIYARAEVASLTMFLQASKMIPGPESEGSWLKDYIAFRFWRRVALQVWNEIPVEFRGEPTNPNTLVEKVRLMANKLEEQQK